MSRPASRIWGQLTVAVLQLPRRDLSKPPGQQKAHVSLMKHMGLRKWALGVLKSLCTGEELLPTGRINVLGSLFAAGGLMCIKKY